MPEIFKIISTSYSVSSFFSSVTERKMLSEVYRREKDRADVEYDKLKEEMYYEIELCFEAAHVPRINFLLFFFEIEMNS